MSHWLAERTSAILGARTSRRGFLVRSAMAGSALVSHSGKVLDVAGLNADHDAPVIHWPWNGGPDQRWRGQTA